MPSFLRSFVPSFLFLTAVALAAAPAQVGWADATPQASTPSEEDSGGAPLYQNGVKVGTISIGTATAQTSITIGNTTYAQSWVKQGEGTYTHADGHSMTVTATTVTITGGPTAGTYQR